MKIGLILSAISYVLLPLNSLWDNNVLVYLGIYFIFLIRIMAGVFSFNASNILINNACPEGLGGRINGIAYGFGAILKAIGPTIGANLFAWSVSNGLSYPFDYTFLYNIIAIISLISFFLTYLIPETINSY